MAEFTQEELDLGPDVQGRVEVGDPGSEGLAESLRAEVALSEVVDKYEILSVDDDGGYMIVADRGTGRQFASTITRDDISISELGSAAPSPWTAWTRQEWVPELRDRQGLTKYYRMRRSDGIVRGTQRAVKTPPLAAHWYVKPATNSARDKKIAEFVQDNLFEELNVSWATVLSDMLLCLDYGYMIFELVWQPVTFEGGKFVQKLRKIAPRHPMDVKEWEYDANGGPDGIWMENSRDNPTEPGIFIPIKKMAIFTLEGEAGDLSGVSILRSAYKHWFYKETLYKIDDIQKERHGIGIPVIKLPLGWGREDRLVAEELGRNLRTNERAHVVLPPGWELLFAKVEGQMVDCMKSIEHHDMAMMANILGPWLKDASVKADSIDMFLKSTRYIAMCLVNIINQFIIKKLVDVNFKLGSGRKYPQMQARRIGEWEDLRTQSFTLRNLVGAGIIEPDDPMEEQLRDEMDLPVKDPATARKMITEPMPAEDDEEGSDGPGKQDGGKAGMPRQRTVPPRGSGAGNAGQDRSGG